MRKRTMVYPVFLILSVLSLVLFQGIVFGQAAHDHSQMKEEKSTDDKVIKRESTIKHNQVKEEVTNEKSSEKSEEIKEESKTDLKEQTKCPVMSEMDIDKKHYSDYEGKRIYFCCESCIEKFEKDPKKYIDQLEKDGITLEKTPEKIDEDKK